MAVGLTRDVGQRDQPQGAVPDRSGRVPEPGRPGVHPGRRSVLCIGSGRLAASLPLVFPWLLYPVITQGDQIIDNLSITWMRIIVHVLLAAIFAMPVAVIVYAARWMMEAVADGQSRNLTLALAGRRDRAGVSFLGALMIGDAGRDDRRCCGCSDARAAARRARRARRSAMALAVLIGGVDGLRRAVSGIQESAGRVPGQPKLLHGSLATAGRLRVDRGHSSRCDRDRPDGDDLQTALTTYAGSLEKLLDGYYILDRNYNYHFHNELFMRSTPLLPNYRAAGLALDRRGAPGKRQRGRRGGRASLPTRRRNPLQALLADVRALRRLQLRARRDARAHERGVRDDQGRPAARHPHLRGRRKVSRRAARTRCSTSIAACCRRRRPAAGRRLRAHQPGHRRQGTRIGSWDSSGHGLATAAAPSDRHSLRGGRAGRHLGVGVPRAVGGVARVRVAHSLADSQHRRRHQPRRICVQSGDPAQRQGDHRRRRHRLRRSGAVVSTTVDPSAHRARSMRSSPARAATPRSGGRSAK